MGKAAKEFVAQYNQENVLKEFWEKLGRADL
jgi:hypothetical protein